MIKLIKIFLWITLLIRLFSGVNLLYTDIENFYVQDNYLNIVVHNNYAPIQIDLNEVVSWEVCNEL